jgi:hypothetical protein
MKLVLRTLCGNLNSNSLRQFSTLNKDSLSELMRKAATSTSPKKLILKLNEDYQKRNKVIVTEINWNHIAWKA